MYVMVSENVFPGLWGMGISDAICLSWYSTQLSQLNFFTYIFQEDEQCTGIFSFSTDTNGASFIN